MSPEALSVLNAALALPEADRVELAERLLESIPSGEDEAWVESADDAHELLAQIAKERAETGDGHNLLARGPSDEKDDLPKAFEALAARWREDTEMHSSMSKKLRHPAYQQIIALGMPAVPLILRELRDRPAFWFEALKAITGQSPVPPGERTDPRRVRDRWLTWGKEKGYIE